MAYKCRACLAGSSLFQYVQKSAPAWLTRSRIRTAALFITAALQRTLKMRAKIFVLQQVKSLISFILARTNVNKLYNSCVTALQLLQLQLQGPSQCWANSHGLYHHLRDHSRRLVELCFLGASLSPRVFSLLAMPCPPLALLCTCDAILQQAEEGMHGSHSLDLQTFQQLQDLHLGSRRWWKVLTKYVSLQNPPCAAPPTRFSP